jgi:pimeloyl-ACP methyl ester carboxylesterase
MSSATILRLRDGRQLAYLESGDPRGKPIFLIQGTPSSRLMRPDETITRELGARLVMFDRPGFGLSDYQSHRTLLDFPNNLVALADALGIERFAIAGISGGGPYTAATAFALPDRVTVAGLISAAGPADAPHALDGITPVRRIGFYLARYAPAILRPVLWLTNNPRHNPEKFFAQYTHHNPPRDQAILAQSQFRAMMIANYAESTRQGLRGFARELWIVARPWGFRLEDIRVPVFVWHGDADNSTPIAMARYVASKIPSCRATYLPGEGHLFLFSRWREILTTLLGENPK